MRLRGKTAYSKTKNATKFVTMRLYFLRPKLLVSFYLLALLASKIECVAFFSSFFPLLLCL